MEKKKDSLKLKKYNIKTINVKDILLDLDNPRYHESLIISGEKKWDRKKLYSIIESEDIFDIQKSIQDFGVVDPIWVVPKNKKFIVIEGNRRVVTLKKLIKEKITPPSGVEYTKVIANVLEKNLPIDELDKQRIILQAGKKDWTPFNISSVITKLIDKHHFTEAQVARMFFKSKNYILRELDNYKYYIEYTSYRKKNKLKENTQKYTYFQRAGNAVREYFFPTFKKRQVFYKLITESNSKHARIRSVSLQGGLMRFNIVCQHLDILELFLKTPSIDVEDAINLIKEDNITLAYPWTKNIKNIESGFINATEDDIKKLRKDKDFVNSLINIVKFSKKIFDE